MQDVSLNVELNLH